MNWQVTRRNHPIVFEEGEPIAMVSPMRRGELERFRPEIHSIAQNPELKAGYEAWMRSRQQHNAGLKVPNSEAQLRGWERHYMQRRDCDRSRCTGASNVTEARAIRRQAQMSKDRVI